MKPWQQPQQKQIVIEREIPKEPGKTVSFECIYGLHKADLLHRGTAYCRACYDEKNLYGKLIN